MGRDLFSNYQVLLEFVSLALFIFVMIWSDLALKERSLRNTLFEAIKLSIAVVVFVAVGLGLVWALAIGYTFVLFPVLIGLFVWFGRGNPPWKQQATPKDYPGPTRMNADFPRVVQLIETGIQTSLLIGVAWVLVGSFAFDIETSLPSTITLAALFGFMQWGRYVSFRRFARSDADLAETVFYNPVDGYFRQSRWLSK
ncbi:hypothetical protein [Shimia sp. MMG029]|uniref:hypothetical protein n=1 Tax=Shimia sp. MMG029 TaxID=3021978 RepID=UPI0022FF3010|nr:hypothetical protein [Shimia sp. MMG029]MDA5557569.1 hypothetical protein [Shimia sp. MMG029]